MLKHIFIRHIIPVLGRLLACACAIGAVSLLIKPDTAETILPEVYAVYFLSARWHPYGKWFLGSLVVTLIGLYAFIAVVDPFDTLEFSPRIHRYSVLGFANERDNMYNDRLAISRFAKDTAFNSAVFGDSAVFMHMPADYEKAFAPQMHLHMINLSMRSARPYEQSLVMHRFIKYHPAPPLLVFVLGRNWCEQDPYMLIEPGPIPASLYPIWLLDSNPWNDYLHIFTWRYLSAAWQQFAYLTYDKADAPGPSTYERTGSVREAGQKFFPSRELKDVRISLYGPTGKGERTGEKISAQQWDSIVRNTTFPRLDLFNDVLKTLPDATVKLVVLQPESWIAQPYPGSGNDAKYSSCKRHIAQIMGRYANTHIVDFVIDSPITRNDAYFWDRIHYDYSLISQLPAWEAEAMKTRKSRKGVYDYITPIRADQ